MYVARGTDGGCWGDGTGCCGDKVLLNTNALLVMGGYGDDERNKLNRGSALADNLLILTCT